MLLYSRTLKLKVLLLSTSVLAAILASACLVWQEARANGSDGPQAEWSQNYELPEGLSIQSSSTPLLSAGTIAATERAIGRYQAIVENGGWATLPAAGTLRVGSRGPAVVALRRRLIADGDLNGEASFSFFDTFLEAGVKRFQVRHGLAETGVVGSQVLRELNVPASLRLRQLRLNLVRLNTMSGQLGGRFVTANIPAATVETVENGVVFRRHTAGVGKSDRQSPILKAKAIDINFNPYWTVPASIIRKDLIPRMRKDANYLSENHIHVFDSESREVPPKSINWNSLEATQYRFREDPGEENSMGVVRINIANPYGVYMHDTSNKGVFGDDFRFVSSGCIRVQNVRDYVSWLLKDTPGWDSAAVSAAMRSGKRIDVKLAQPVPVYWVYITAWATSGGVVNFRPDIYDRDRLTSGHQDVSTAEPDQKIIPATPQN